MKKTLLFLLMLLHLTIQAQDVIVLNDATEFEAKVLEINEDNIRYKKWNNLEGPTYVINAKEIFFIKYENGTKDVFHAKDNKFQSPSNTQNVSNNSNQQDDNETQRISNNDNKKEIIDQEKLYTRPFIKKIRFHSYPSVAFYSSCKEYRKEWNGHYKMQKGCFYGFDLNWSFGVRFYDYGYLGILTGVNFNIGEESLYLPIRIHMRGYYPINRIIHPFIEFAGGVEITLVHADHWPYKSFGFSCTTIFGFDLDHFSIGLGYYYSPAYFSPHNLYLKVGIKIGKKS